MNAQISHSSLKDDFPRNPLHVISPSDALFVSVFRVLFLSQRLNYSLIYNVTLI